MDHLIEQWQPGKKEGKIELQKFENFENEKSLTTCLANWSYHKLLRLILDPWALANREKEEKIEIQKTWTVLERKKPVGWN